MSDSIVLCVMGMMFPKKEKVGDVTVEFLPTENLYSDEQGQSTVSGIQANEAPIKYLIEQGHKNGCPVTNIVYLCSDKVLKPIITADMVSELFDLQQDAEPMSTEAFLMARIDKFCDDNGYESPSFDPIAYDPLRPADSLSAITDMFWENSRISIDITGGQRDAVLLLTIAIQIIKMGSRGISIGDIVYSNLEERLIIRQNNTFDMVDLINAVNAFTEYGRANQLNDFFGVKKKWTTSATKELVAAMDQFSDSLALCQVGNIEEQVRSIHECMRSVEETLSAKRRTYNLFTDAICQIDEPSWLHELGFDDALQKLSQIDGRVTVETPTQNDLKEALRKWQWDYVIERNELLFFSLLPTIKEKFVQESSEPGMLAIGVIRWCIRHQMIQQALCIYRERISQCLLDLGFFRKKPAFEDLDGEMQEKEIADMCLNCSVNEKGVWVHQNVLPGDSPATRQAKYKAQNDYLEVVPEKEGEARIIVAWYKYLHVTRNAIMHVDSDQGNYAYFFALAFLGKDRDATPTLSELVEDMYEALRAIDEPEAVSDEEWNEARSIAGRDYRRFKQRVADGTTKLDKKAYSSKPKGASSKRLSGSLDAGNLAKLEALKTQLADD